MSQATDDRKHGHGAPGHGGGADAVRYDMVIIVGVASLAIFALSIWWAGSIMHSVMGETERTVGRARPVPQTFHPNEIGIVDQVPFAHDERLHGWRAERKRELETYTWVDKEKGIVRMPVEAAMEKIVGGAMPAGAPQ
jgi:hypothetical protein